MTDTHDAPTTRTWDTDAYQVSQEKPELSISTQQYGRTTTDFAFPHLDEPEPCRPDPAPSVHGLRTDGMTMSGERVGGCAR